MHTKYKIGNSVYLDDKRFVIHEVKINYDGCAKYRVVRAHRGEVIDERILTESDLNYAAREQFSMGWA